MPKSIDDYTYDKVPNDEINWNIASVGPFYIIERRHSKTGEVLGYKVWHSKKGKFIYTLDNPNDIQSLKDNIKEYSDPYRVNPIIAVQELSQEYRSAPEYLKKSEEYLQRLMEGKFGEAFKALGKSYVEAFKDPGWWAQMGISVMGSYIGASSSYPLETSPNMISAEGAFLDEETMASTKAFGMSKPSSIQPAPAAEGEVTALNSSVKAIPKSASATRPTPAQLGIDVADDFGFEKQQSFKQGRPIRYGAKGSVRPDASNLSGNIHIEVKNYNLSNSGNRANMYRDIAEQAKERAINLPSGAHQGIVIDIRGQTVDPTLIQRIPINIENKTGGMIPRTNVVFKTDKGYLIPYKNEVH